MGEPSLVHFGRTLRYHRTAAGLGQEELAERAGLSARGIRALEAGDRSPRLETVRLLADALDLAAAARAQLLAAARPELTRAQPRSTAPETSPLPISARLPVAPTRLVGREGDVAKICSLLRGSRPRLLTLTGPGGVGKTRAALAAAAELAADYSDGVAFVDLAPIREPDLVAPTLCRTLGVPEDNGQLPVEGLIAFVADRTLLMVLDNCEQILPGMPLVARLLAASPNLKILATSRERLHLRGERDLVIAPLALPALPSGPTDPVLLTGLANVPSVRLFLERADDAAAGFSLNVQNARAVAEICLRLEGLPLAIELAAAHMCQLTPDALLHRLERRLPLLTDGPRDLPERQRTMQQTIAWSYGLLSGHEQALFRRLAVFAGGFTSDAASVVGASSASEMLEAMVSKSLLQRRHGAADGTSRFAMLELVREFAAEKLTKCGEESAARDRHAIWMLTLMEAASPRIDPTLRTPDAAQWLSHVQVEQDNLHAALSWLDISGKWMELLRLAAAAAHFWDLHLRAREGRFWLELALDQSRNAEVSPNLRARALRGLGRLTLNLGDYDAAESALTGALAVYTELGDEVGAANTLRLLGAVAEYRGDDDLCRVRGQAALEHFRSIGDSVGMAGSLDDLADLAFRRNDFAEAKRLADASVVAAREGGSPVRLVTSLATLGEATSARGAMAAAAAALREGLSLAWELGFDFGIVDNVAVLAEVAVRTEHGERSARLLGAASALADAHGLAKMPHHALFRETEEAARQILGDSTFAAAWEVGAASPIEQMVMEAMDQAELLSDRS